MKLIFSIGFILLIVFSPGCKNDDEDHKPLPRGDYPFNEDYFYYTFDWEKIRIYLYKDELAVKFKSDTIGTEEVLNLVKKYFLSRDSVQVKRFWDNNWLQLKMINEDSIYLKEIISLLNTDPQVDFSTPVFSLNPEPKYSDYQCECEDVILLSDEIICSLLITENDIESELAEFGLSIIKQTHTYTLLKVANIKTGFESLGIAAYLYESGKFKYCTPGFMSCLCLAN